jgi:hypothetical protein
LSSSAAAKTGDFPVAQEDEYPQQASQPFWKFKFATTGLVTEEIEAIHKNMIDVGSGSRPPQNVGGVSRPLQQLFLYR